MPAPIDLKELAQREGLNYEMTPLLSREQAEQYGQIAGAEVGMARLSGGRKFADEFFDPKKALYEPEELTDLLGTRFLARKIKDVPPHVPSLDEVRSEVSLAWKMAKARPLAREGRRELAEQLKKKADAIKEATVDGFRVVTIPADRAPANQLPCQPIRVRRPRGDPDPRSRRTPASRSETPTSAFSRLGRRRRQPTPNRLLRHGRSSVASRPPSPPSTPPTATSYRYKMSASEQAARQLDEQWMGWLRQQAGLETDWVPPDEAKGKSVVRDDA